MILQVNKITNEYKIDALIHLAWSDIPNFSYSKMFREFKSINKPYKCYFEKIQTVKNYWQVAVLNTTNLLVSV